LLSRSREGLDHRCRRDLASGHENGTTNQDLTTRQTLREPENEYSASHHFDSTKNRSDQKTSVPAPHYQLEVLRTKVCECRGTRCLLGCEYGEGSEYALEVLAL
jgi:hypothetical protein